MCAPNPASWRQSQRRLQPVGIRQTIRIQKRNHFAARLRCPIISHGGDAGFRLQYQPNRDLRFQLRPPRNFRCPVRRSVVHHQNLKVGRTQRLPAQAGKTISQVLLLVVGRNDYRNLHSGKV